MRRSVVRRKLGRVDRAIDKAIGQAEIPGAVVLARMPREGEELEHLSQRGLAPFQNISLCNVRNMLWCVYGGKIFLHSQSEN